MSEVNPNISIVVPVYNVEKYLVRCLDSIFQQQFSGTYEVIAVEDASTDSSLQILRNYQKKEPTLKIIEHEVNKKLSIARATGMKASAGDYIMHVDSDDWLLPNALANLYRKCLESKADVVAFNHVRENDNGERVSVDSIKEEIITNDKLRVQDHFYRAPWSKIVRRALTTNMISGQVGINNTEDLLYASEILLRASTICLIPEFYYVYFVNTMSLTSLAKTQEYLRHQIVILNQLQKILSEYKADSKLTTNFLDYFEKWIYVEFAKMHFCDTSDLSIGTTDINEFFRFPIMTPSRIHRMKLSIKNRYVNILEVALRFGLKPALNIAVRGKP